LRGDMPAFAHAAVQTIQHTFGSFVPAQLALQFSPVTLTRVFLLFVHQLSASSRPLHSVKNASQLPLWSWAQYVPFVPHEFCLLQSVQSPDLVVRQPVQLLLQSFPGPPWRQPAFANQQLNRHFSRNTARVLSFGYYSSFPAPPPSSSNLPFCKHLRRLQ